MKKPEITLVEVMKRADDIEELYERIEMQAEEIFTHKENLKKLNDGLDIAISYMRRI